MRIRLLALLIAAVTALAGLSAPAAAATGPSNLLRSGATLATNGVLRSANGAYTATVTAYGRLVLRHRGTMVWASHSRGRNPRLTLGPRGNLFLWSGHRVLWQTNTVYSNASALVLTNAGNLALVSAGGTVWSYRVGNPCGSGAQAGKRILINLSRQFARLCDHAQQVLTTPITSGASARGDGTPTGVWRLQAKQRDRYLYPAAGGAYYVHYWLPYDGAYGMHDSSWQHFPYGSSRYRTAGSHGCVHFPRAAIAWMFGWAPIGTLVSIHY